MDWERARGGGATISPPGIMIVEPIFRGIAGSRPLNCAISFASPPYFFASDFNVSPFTTMRSMPETGRMMRMSPGRTSRALLRSFAQIIVFTETLNIAAISERVSPLRTGYTEIRSGGVSFEISEIVPDSPVEETRAPPEIASAIGADEFGLLLSVACNAGVEELGTVVLTAASALEEKGQNAFTWLGTRITKDATIVDPNIIEICGLDLMGKRGEAVCLQVQEWLTYSRI